MDTFTSNKQLLFKRYGIFSANPYFIYFLVFSYTHCQENCFTLTKLFFYFYFKKFNNLHNFNHDEHIK